MYQDLFLTEYYLQKRNKYHVLHKVLCFRENPIFSHYYLKNDKNKIHNLQSLLNRKSKDNFISFLSCQLAT